MKESQIAPDSETTTVSHISKVFTPTYKDHEIKYSGGFSKAEIVRNNFYLVPNPKVADHSKDSNPYMHEHLM